jgi:hypothetical protein
MENPMREVFENLAEQAMVHVPGQTGLHTRAFSLEKFAELIVEECIECADIVGKANLASGYPNSTAHHVKQKIREHFEVEE